MKHSRGKVTLWLVCVCLLISGCGRATAGREFSWQEVPTADLPAILEQYQPAQEMQWLEELTSPVYGGRIAGTPQEDAAGEVIIEVLEELGLQPWVAAGLTGYRHVFELGGSPIAENIVAVLPGQVSDQFLLFGAHYDHIGAWGSRQAAPADTSASGQPPATAAYYPGADDNGSGTVALLAAAQAMVNSGRQPYRSIVFVFFSAEERGLIGSQALVRQLQEVELLEDCIVLNMDMLAGQGGNQLTVLDQGNRELNGAISDRAVAEIEASGLSGYQFAGAGGRVDSMSFTPVGVPAISLFWGSIETDHPFYHTPDDDFESVQTELLEQATRAAIRVAWCLSFCRTAAD